MYKLVKYIDEKGFLFKNLIIFISYFIFARFGLFLALPGTAASIIWFPAGICYHFNDFFGPDY